RRSYARYILCGAGGERNYDLKNLADEDPEALAPWADHVAGFHDRALERLVSVDFCEYWRVTAGASDAAVDDLAARILKQPPKPLDGGAAADPAQARAGLLIGCDTERALSHLGTLGRAHDA